MLTPGTVTRWLSLLAMVSILGACTTSPTGRSQLILIDDAQMDQMGAAAFTEYRKEHERLTDERVQRYVSCVGRSVIAELPGEWRGRDWQIEVFQDDTPNAFALPGGRIGVNSGMLEVAETQDQLAAVIGHEIGHVLARHGAERVSQQFATQTALSLADSLARGHTGHHDLLMSALGVGAQVGVLLPYSRAHEAEADRIGLDLMARAGFDPKAAVDLWRNMERSAKGATLAFLSTHPSHGQRIDALSRDMPAAERLYRDALAAGHRPACR